MPEKITDPLFVIVPVLFNPPERVSVVEPEANVPVLESVPVTVTSFAAVMLPETVRLLNVTVPVIVFDAPDMRIVPVEGVNVPLTVRFPSSVMVCVPAFTVAPELTVSVPATVAVPANDFAFVVPLENVR